MVPFRAVLVLLLLASPLVGALGEPQPVGQVRHFPSGGDSRSPQLGWNGGWLVTWGNAGGAARISAAGEPVDVPAILVHERPAHIAAGVVPADDGWLVGSVGRGFIDLHRINRDGEVVARETRSIPSEEGWFHFAWMVRTDGDVVVGWRYEENTYLYSVERNQIMTVQGTAVDLAGAGDRIFLAFSDRVVEIGAALEIRRSLLLPESLAVLDLVEDGGEVKVITLDARIASSDVS
ncbi:MAG: hypothetical protein LC732_00690, partial [Acidobacteria bacterium]|nr:hypothetical protein [Acidobacteriota bacterium]